MEKIVSHLHIVLFLSIAQYMACYAQSNANNSTTNGSSAKQADLYVIDQIAAVIMNDEGTEIITLSEAQRPSLSGAPTTVQDMANASLIALDAAKHKVIIDDNAINKYLESLQTGNNMTRQQLEEILTQAGYTMEEALKALKQIQANNVMIEYEIKSNLIVSTKAIEKYYNETPEYTEEMYQFTHALLPFKEGLSPEEQRTTLNHEINALSSENRIAWDSPFWSIKEELGETIQALTSHDIGAISEPIITEKGFDLFRLTDKQPKRLKTLEERYQSIAATLRQARAHELMEQYTAKLHANSSVEIF